MALLVGLLAMFAFVAGASAGVFSGRGTPVRLSADRARSFERSSRVSTPTATAVRQTPVCKPVAGYSGYQNPLENATVMGERIDQGVDYAGTGSLVALGPARVSYVGTAATGWPGTFIEYRLTAGANRGCYVYYAEGINPAGGLHVGQSVAAGQVLATIIPGWPTGIELGWGAGVSTKTYAARHGQWNAMRDSDSIASAAGRSFSAVVASLGGPPGRAEG